MHIEKQNERIMQIYIGIMRTPPVLYIGFNGFTNYKLECKHISIIEKHHKERFMNLLTAYYCSKAFDDKEGMFKANQGLDKLEFTKVWGVTSKKNFQEYLWPEFFRNWKIQASGLCLEQSGIFLEKDHFKTVEYHLINSK